MSITSSLLQPVGTSIATGNSIAHIFFKSLVISCCTFYFFFIAVPLHRISAAEKRFEDYSLPNGTVVIRI